MLVQGGYWPLRDLQRLREAFMARVRLTVRLSDHVCTDRLGPDSGAQ